MASEGWRFTDNPRARHQRWKHEMKLQKSNYHVQEKIKKEQMKQSTRMDYLHRKWEMERKSWGHKHPKR